MKRHKVKQERSEGSRGHKSKKQNDLAYCIHDRVELLHQVFSLLKPKEIKAMAPDCVRDISLDDLQELCLEELLGISSKRLLAALDGAPPPSDTESSSDDSERRRGANNLDTISLDSISSDEGVLSTGHGSEKNKKRKHCKRRDKRKRSERGKAEAAAGAAAGGVRERAAERAGLTVLELLELQARARAIRAQLNADIERKNAAAAAVAASGVPSASDDDVEIKEEPPEVVELVSSEDEVKPDLTQLQASVVERPAAPTQSEPAPSEASQAENDTRVVTKRADLTIIVPKTPTARKIKLNRQKAVTIAATSNTLSVRNNVPTPTSNTDNGASTSTATTSTAQNNAEEQENRNTKTRRVQVEDTTKKKDRIKKRKKAKRKTDAEGSDHDEIMLQLSDSEKMDLLENFDRKRYEQVTSSSSEEDSEDEVTNESPSHVAIVAENDVAQDSVNNKTDVKNNGDGSIVTKKDVDSHSGIQGHVDNNSEKNNLKTNDGKDAPNSEDVLNMDIAGSPNKDAISEHDKDNAIDKVKNIAVKTVESVEQKNEVTFENLSSAEDNTINQQGSDEATESNCSSAIQDNEKPPILEEVNATEAAIVTDNSKEDAISNTQDIVDIELSPAKSVEDPVTDINVTLHEVDNSDVETTKKAKKKKSKKEKKSKKDKKNK